MDAQALYKAIPGLWEAALEPDRWAPALERIASAAGGAGCSVLSTNPKFGCLVNDELREVFDIYFAEGWDQLDLRRRGIPRLMRGEVLTDCDVVSSDDIANSPYYSEFLPRIGIKWWLGTGFMSGDGFYCLAVQSGRSREPFSADDKLLFSGLHPTLLHLGRFMDVMARSVVDSVIGALTKLSEAAICLGADGKIIEVNSLAHRLFDEEFGVRDSRIYIKDQRVRDDFASALSACLFGRYQAGSVVVLRSDRAPLSLRLVRLHQTVQAPFFGASAIVIAKELLAAREVDCGILMKAFGLTLAESKLASHLVVGHSLEKAAGCLSISKETARNQLKSIFSKTGTHRQGELVALLVAVR